MTVPPRTFVLPSQTLTRVVHRTQTVTYTLPGTTTVVTTAITIPTTITGTGTTITVTGRPLTVTHDRHDRHDDDHVVAYECAGPRPDERQYERLLEAADRLSAAFGMPPASRRRSRRRPKRAS